MLTKLKKKKRKEKNKWKKWIDDKQMPKKNTYLAQ